MGSGRPFLTLFPETAAQRERILRKVFDGLRYVVRYGVAWRAMHLDLAPWDAGYDQNQRWLIAGCFEKSVYNFARRFAIGVRPRSGTFSRNPRQPDAALDARERCPRRMGRT